MPVHPLEFIFNPRSVAIVGASENPSSISSCYVQHFKNYGFKGDVYPINPKRAFVYGYQAYPNLKSVPGPVDYVIDCIALGQAPDLLAESHRKGVKAVHLFTGRASETGRKEAIETEEEILRLARRFGLRLIGPNCMGIYNPKAGLSTGWDFPQEPGPVGAALQSGGISQNLVRIGAERGMRFSKVVSYGNALDLDECDFLDYLAQDLETKAIMCYLEGVKDGKRYFRTLRQAAKLKPVIVLKGGRTRAGTLAAASHTAALAGSSDIWATLIKQCGAIQAFNFEDWIDLGVGFSMIPPIKALNVGITGGGGGTSVLNADECEEMGFHVIPLPWEIREQLREKVPLIWDWVGNPVDSSIMRGTGVTNGEILMMMARHPAFDFLLGQVSDDIPSDVEDFSSLVRAETEGYLQVFRSGLKPIVIVLRSRNLASAELDNWRSRLFAEVQTRLVEARVPFFPAIGRALRAMREIIKYYNTC